MKTPEEIAAILEKNAQRIEKAASENSGYGSDEYWCFIRGVLWVLYNIEAITLERSRTKKLKEALESITCKHSDDGCEIIRIAYQALAEYDGEK